MFFINNNGGSSANIGHSFFYDDRSSIPRNDCVVHQITRTSALVTSLNVSADNFYTPQQFNLLRNIADPNNGTAANRSKISVNGGADVQNNAATNAPSTANATNNLTMGKNSAAASGFLKGDISEIFISENQPT
jgi:hypothetical protein